MYGVELSAVRVMLGSLVEVLLGQVIWIEPDNTTIVSYIFSTVGLSSPGYRSIGRFLQQGQDCLGMLFSVPALDRALAENG